MNEIHRRIDELEKMIFSLSLLGGGLGTGSPTGGPPQTCGLTFNPSSLNFTIPVYDTGSIAQSVTVTSSVAQTVTFTASLLNAPSCLGTPTVTPSTVNFLQAGQQLTIVVSIPYMNCTASGQSFSVTLAYTTSTGCSGYMGGKPGAAGTGTTSSSPIFVIEVECTSNPACCGSDYLVYASVAANLGYGAGNCPYEDYVYCGPNHTCADGNCAQCLGGSSGYTFRVRSVNGFAGTINFTCSSNACFDNICNVGFTTPVTLAAGQTVIGFAGGLCFAPGNGNPAGPYHQTVSCFCLIAGTSSAAPPGYVSQAQCQVSEINLYC